jgi:hypothetical protein
MCIHFWHPRYIVTERLSCLTQYIDFTRITTTPHSGPSIVKRNKYLILTLEYIYISVCCVKYGSCYCENVVSGTNYTLPRDPLQQAVILYASGITTTITGRKLCGLVLKNLLCCTQAQD